MRSKYDNVLAAAVSTDGSRHIDDLAALQNLLNNNSQSVLKPAGAPASRQSVHVAMAAVKHCGGEPSVASSAPSSAPSASNGNRLLLKCDRYKTELCRTYEENGTCRYGDKCQFAHGTAELRTVARHPKYKTDLCRTFHTTGFCPYGSRCHFIHSLHERQLPVQPLPSRLSVHAAGLLLAQQLQAKSNYLTSVPLNGRTVAEQQSLDNVLQTLSSLLRANQLAADPVAAGLLAREWVGKLAAQQQNAAEFLRHHRAAALPHRLSLVSDTTSVSTDSTSPCPSPTSFNCMHDDPCTPYFAANAAVDHVPRNAAGFQLSAAGAAVPASVLSPPGSPGSVASSLGSFPGDYDGHDATWSGRVWPALLSPAKNVRLTPIPDFAHSHLLTSKHSIFA